MPACNRRYREAGVVRVLRRWLVPRADGGSVRLAQQQQHRDDGDGQYDTQQKESIPITHQIGLLADVAADRYHRRALGLRRIGDAVGQEIVRQLREATPRRLVEQRNRIGQHVGVELLALGDEGLQYGDTDGAAEIAHHVEERRGQVRGSCDKAGSTSPRPAIPKGLVKV